LLGGREKVLQILGKNESHDALVSVRGEGD